MLMTAVFKAAKKLLTAQTPIKGEMAQQCYMCAMEEGTAPPKR